MWPMRTWSVKGIAYFYVGVTLACFWEKKRILRIQTLYDCQKDNVKGIVEIVLWKSANNVFRFIDLYPVIFYHWRNRIQISNNVHLITHLFLARNCRDVTIKNVHSENHSDVNRRVVIVFKVTVFCIGGKDCLKLCHCVDYQSSINQIQFC